MDDDLVRIATNYVRIDPNEQSRAEIAGLLLAGNAEGLGKLLKSRLAFGTAGLRGPMGGGYNRMNDLVILQTTQGLSKYLLAEVGESAKAAGVVIGYDHRAFGSLSSLNFARMCAAVFLNQGFRVYLLEGFVPTPFVAFGVKKLGCCCGIMVTASHNPKRDDGFKVYWGNGSQIIPPHDAGIAASIEANLEPWTDSHDCAGVPSHPLASDVTADIAAAYFAEIVKLVPAATAGPTKVAYTAMHGVGKQWLVRAFAAAGLTGPAGSEQETLSVVPSQAEPDPEFPTVVFPNPEEKGALDEAMGWAAAQGCPVIIANDPDADRLAAAERGAGAGAWRVFTGNEIGTLLGHWQIEQHQKQQAQGQAQAQVAVLASVVSSRMLSIVAAAEGVRYVDTLTGFKWLGNKAAELQAAGTRVLFSYEEALGYCCGDVVNDKDGISAALVFVRMANELYAQGQTLAQRLDGIYRRYGRVVSLNSYVFCHDGALTDRIFARIRAQWGVDAFAAAASGAGAGLQICGVEVKRIVDVTLGRDTAASDGRSELPVTADSHMLMFACANGVSLTLRTSGTEPKIKYYTEIAGSPASGDGAAEAGEEAGLAATLKAFVSAAVEEMLQPTLHGLASP